MFSHVFFCWHRPLLCYLSDLASHGYGEIFILKMKRRVLFFDDVSYGEYKRNLIYVLSRLIQCI